MASGADPAAKIPIGMARKLAAILSADVVSYSRLMGDDEEATIHTLKCYREVLGTVVAQHRGRVVDSPGDNLLAEFPSVVEAVQCAVTIQREIYTRNLELPPQRRMHFRLGINLGDVLVEGEQIYGDGINIAARLESLADPGGICISGTVYDQIATKLAFGYEFVGQRTVKNITHPVRVYRVQMEPGAVISPRSTRHRRAVPTWRRGALVVGLLLVVGGGATLGPRSWRPFSPAGVAPAP
jgi:class 3 adenylate cyclase